MGNLSQTAAQAARAATDGTVSSDLWTPWHERLYADMPSAREVRRRNAAVTSRYATFYKSRPDLLKWAGVAAFASHRVGLALTPYQAVERVEEAVGDLDGYRPDLDPDIELLRQTNNQVFHDMSWAHAAFLSDGFGAVRDVLSSRTNHAFMLEGFRHLDRARRLLRGPWRAQVRARRLVWEGTALLLKQEQFVTVQPQFERITPEFRRFLSVATSMDFDADHWLIDWFAHTSFPWFMYTRGTSMLLRTWSWPNIARRDHRWLWASKAVLEIWRYVDGWDPTLASRIDRLIDGRGLLDG